MARKDSTTEVEKPAFDVSKTDKRNDKRVLVDYVFATRYAPELVSLFAPYADALDEVLATEGLQPITTPVDTQIEALKAKVEERYNGEYSDYELRGNAASFFTEKQGRTRMSPEAKAEKFVENASDEQLAALQAILAARGLAVAPTE